MKGMIYKDLLNIKTQIIYYSAAIAAITVVSLFQNNIYFFCGFILFVSLGSLMSAMTYDQQDGWNRFAIASGVPKSKLVSEKYLLSLLLTLSVMVLGVVIACVMTEAKGESVFAVLTYGMLAFIMASFIIPLFIKYGSEKARLFFIGCFLIAVMLFAGSVGLADKFGAGNFYLISVIITSICAATAFFISYFVSLSIFKNKDFT